MIRCPIYDYVKDNPALASAAARSSAGIPVRLMFFIEIFFETLNTLRSF